MKRIITIASILFIVLACDNNPKNVILLISDGTGLSQISSAFYFKKTLPNYARFKHIGLIKTSSSKQKVTDSAASGTAFACGVKTYNGAIGVTDDSLNVKNIIEIISPKDIKSGIIATSSITHATPASFYAHAISRSFNEIIASDLVQSDVDFFAGGGLKYFNNRRDSLDLLTDLKNKNFTVDTTSLKDYSEIQSSEKVGYLLSKNSMPKILEGRGDFLTEATELAIQFLSKDNSNFFIMAEGSQIDWGGHRNDGPYIVSELIDFDNTIGKVLDYAEKDGNTLVVVTSDHETSGFALKSAKKKTEIGKEYRNNEIDLIFATKGHTATLIPVFAYGPGAEEFSGVYEINDIFEKIFKVTKW